MNLPTMRGANVMMDVRVQVIHIGRQYTHFNGIWQVSMDINFDQGAL